MLPHDIAGSMTAQIKYYKICFSPPSIPGPPSLHSVVQFDTTGRCLASYMSV